MHPPYILPTKPIRDYARGELALTILKCAALGVVISGMLLFPNMAQCYALFRAATKKEKRRIRYAIAQLQREELLGRRIAGPLEPTAKGRRRAAYDALQIIQMRWDKQWRLFMFDIPEEKRAARKILSRKVLDMGMNHFQKSVFISPYPCERELREASRFLGVEKWIRFAMAKQISDGGLFKKRFKL